MLHYMYHEVSNSEATVSNIITGTYSVSGNNHGKPIYKKDRILSSDKQLHCFVEVHFVAKLGTKLDERS